MYRRNAETRLLEEEQALEHGIETSRGWILVEVEREAVPGAAQA